MILFLIFAIPAIVIGAYVIVITCVSNKYHKLYRYYDDKVDYMLYGQYHSDQKAASQDNEFLDLCEKRNFYEKKYHTAENHKIEGGWAYYFIFCLFATIVMLLIIVVVHGAARFDINTKAFERNALEHDYSYLMEKADENASAVVQSGYEDTMTEVRQFNRDLYMSKRIKDGKILNWFVNPYINEVDYIGDNYY